MVSSLLADALADPTVALVDLYDPAEALDSFPAKVTKHFSDVFASQKKLEEHQIPLLGLSNPPESHKDRALVRFYAMVQDTSPSPEMYLARQPGGKCGGWGLAGDQSDTEGMDYRDLSECTVLWAVSIPGESFWCRSTYEGLSPDSTAPAKPIRPEKYPIPSTENIGAQVKVYENRNDVDPYKVTALVIFVGILTAEPMLNGLDFEVSSLVPTIHVLFSRPLSPTIVPRQFPSLAANTNTRQALIEWIADEALGGDQDAAEWVLLCAIARVQSRTPPILPPVLTISCFPPCSKSDASGGSRPPGLSHVLQQLVPVQVTIPLSLETLNKTDFSPHSENEDLHSGWLQLPFGSVTLITESGITEGNVSERGISNLRAIQEVMNGQTLDYVFPFSQFSFQTDMSLLVLTEGRKSTFFKTSINYSLAANKVETSKFYKSLDEIHLPGKEALEQYRELIGGAKVGKVNLDDKTAEVIQDDFVNERRSSTGASMVTSDDLIHTMLIARLLALSYHEQTISVDLWEKAKSLESRRKQRLS